MLLEEPEVLVNEIRVMSATARRWDGKIADMRLPLPTIISCIIRDAEVTVPKRAETRSWRGDRLVVMTTPESQKEAVKAIIGSEEMKSDKMIWETFGAKYQDDRRTLKGGRPLPVIWES